ncbi:MAG: penicillin-binding protein 1A [Desulfobacteraceae bacterium]|nr:penicillin-binding protein 1A [Desulfobacteraceae bacterium]
MKKSLWIKLSLLAVAAIACGVAAAAGFSAIRDLPEIRSLEQYAPSTVSRIYSADRVVLAELYVEKRDPVKLEQIPDNLVDALITTEDRQFYEHSGLDLKGILRAVITDIKTWSFAEGASTITQQLAKTLFLTPEKSLERKFKEAVLALQMERRYTKDEILEMYLNQVYFGSGAYGVQTAAQAYYAKPVSELDLAECALIAGLPKSPSSYSPLINPELAIQRRNIVLRQMLETGKIDRQTYEKAAESSYKAPEKTPGKKTKAPYFIDYVKQKIEDAIGWNMLYKGGVTIYTTLSWQLQQAAEHAVKQGLSGLGARMKRKGLSGNPPQGALIAMDVQTGGILAMVGGRNYGESSYNRATTARRQPGSAFKPIIYACAIENGFSQDSTLLDAPVSFPGGSDGRQWRPENYSGGYEGEITLRKALTDSKNIPSVRLLAKIGPKAAIDFARGMGINSPLSSDLTMTLGTSGVTLLELTSAYSVFPNRGMLIKPRAVEKVLGPDGRVIMQERPEKRIAMSRTGAAIMTDMLKGVINEGTGQRAEDLGYEIAGKTGTTDECRDALFVGFSPDIAAGVWVGRDDNSSLGPYETGARAALPVWKTFMKQALKDRSLKYFDFPGELEQVRIDPYTGKKVSGEKGVIARLRKNR